MPAWTPLVSGLRSGGGRRAAAALVAALVAAALVFCLRLHAGAGPRSGLLPCCLLDGRASAQLPLRAEPGPALEVVVSHYSAPLDWVAQLLDRLPANGTQLTIYSKAAQPPPGAMPLPNVGREAHAFVQHLWARYDSLAEVTLLLMDSSPQHAHDKVGKLLRGWRRAQHSGFFCAGLDREAPPYGFQLERWQGTTDGAGAVARSTRQRTASGPLLLPASPRPFGAWWAEHIAGPLPRAFCPNAMMAVHRNRVRLRPRAFYAALLQQFSEGTNLEASHYMERSWAALFYAPEAVGGCASA